MVFKESEVAEHNNAESCWVIIHGKVYDMTEFLPDHPGGPETILQHAGKDATAVYDPIHPSDTLDKYLDPSKHLGSVALSTTAQTIEETPEELERQDRIAHKPLLSQCYNLFDFEVVARRVLTKGAWAYYSSAADNEITAQENQKVFHRIWFRPRVLINVEHVDVSTTMLGTKVSIPIYVTATALNKLAHPDGEVIFTRASHKYNIIQMIPTLSSRTFDEIIDARGDDQVQWLQLYVNRDRAVTKKIVQYAEQRVCKGLFITVDNPQVGRRERDLRSKYNEQTGQETGGFSPNRGTTSLLDPSLSWADIPWFQSITSMPIVLKGVQRVEDVLKAVEYGCQGVILSNHGGRQLDFARSSIEVLAETMPVLRERGLEDKIEVYVDGGVRRGTDILKALCLGARGVGIGRPFLYAMGAYGQPGVERAIQLLKDELETDMRLIGCNRIDELHPGLLSVRSLPDHSTHYEDSLSAAVYRPLEAVPQRERAKL
ncbi:FMN-dependent dehydrogenase-domain-containing protein [Dactylonectria macrodidyma]|uniref:L-lactate dehydrogenase (cytochrome) n=1 Tax=Dactylonectria macrodidyma TaxID=307937 RepID=A0A9P9FA81_9HYPO|nr:FMN-dependent dehydrogenase-domain-containing protein [Dactylonectria macrodidyma]